jgi:hypothetical protein
MDYGFLTSQEPAGVGSYDDAAIQVLYGANEGNTRTLLAQNYFFCTDEHIMDSRNGLCNQFDTGTSLTDLVKGQLDRYYASFVFNNVRGDRVALGSSRDYMSRISRYLIPMRLAFDNAQAILNAAKASSPASFWYVAGQRVEADADTKPEDIIKIKVADSFAVALTPGKWELQPHTVERNIDKAKIESIIVDAEEAQSTVFQALLGIILDEDRPIYSTGDLIHDELQIRGTLPDKILALLFLYSRTGDPSGNGGVITPFRDLRSGGPAAFLTHLLANTHASRHQSAADGAQSSLERARGTRLHGRGARYSRQRKGERRPRGDGEKDGDQACPLGDARAEEAPRDSRRSSCSRPVSVRSSRSRPSAWRRRSLKFRISWPWPRPSE